MKEGLIKAAAVFFTHGHVGMYFTWRLHWMDRKLRQLQQWKEAERLNHAQEIQLLNAEMNDLMQRQQQVRFDAARYWSSIATGTAQK